MRRVALAGLALLLFGGILTLFISLGSDAEPSSPKEGARDEPDESWTREQAVDLAARLTSGDLDDLESAYAAPEGQALDPGLASGLAALKLEFDATTFNAVGDGQAQVLAAVTDEQGGRSRWLVTLLQVDNTWKVLGTDVQGGP